MQFNLTVDLDEVSGDPAKELVRILRYWATQLDGEDVASGNGVNVYDSRFNKVGRWEITSVEKTED